MIRRTDTFVSQPISTSIEPTEVETQQVENRTSTALEQPAASHRGGATQISEFNLQEQRITVPSAKKIERKGYWKL